MADGAAVFALANPTPEVMPQDVPVNVAVLATGRSDFPNQINNVLAFPGVFRGLLDSGAKKCTIDMKIAAAQALSATVEEPNPAHHPRRVRAGCGRSSGRRCDGKCLRESVAR